MIEHIECFEPQFQLLVFAHWNDSGNTRVENPTAWTFNAAHTHIAKRAECRQAERGRIQKVTRRFVSVRIPQHLIRSLDTAGGGAAATAVQCVVLTTGHTDVVAG